MDARTAAAYRRHAGAWIEARGPRALACRRLAQLCATLRRGARVADLGCGPGWYAERFRRRGFATVALDCSAPMLAAVATRSPRHLRVCADLAALPFAPGVLDAAWAINCYQHLGFEELPLALALLHRSLAPGAPVALTLTNLDALDATARERRRGVVRRRFDDEYGQRLFTALDDRITRLLFEGAGFRDVLTDVPGAPFWRWVRAKRAPGLPDYVRPRLDLLVCGLNPSRFAAQTGIPYGHPSNRFWSAARDAGLIDVANDPFAALRRGVGFTDLVKRVTRSASELGAAEYQRGLVRLEALVALLEPRAVCFVGLEGWRRAVDRRARPGRLRDGFAGRPAYLMPSTSGLNARAGHTALVGHLRRATRV